MSNLYSTFWLLAALGSGFFAGIQVQREPEASLFAQLSVEEREDLRSQLRERRSSALPHRAHSEPDADRIADYAGSETSGLSIRERNLLREQLRLVADGAEPVAINERFLDNLPQGVNRAVDGAVLEVSAPSR